MEETKIHFQIQNVVVGVELQLSEMATKYRPISLTTDKISSFTYKCAKTVAGNLCISPVLGQFMFQHNSQQHQGFLQPQKVITAARDHRIIEKG